ncbi:hypothetical protein Tco_1453073, partial [Tanacetum coccineum]
GCGGGGSVDVVSVVAVKLEGTPADAVRALKKHLSVVKQDLIICGSGWCHSSQPKLGLWYPRESSFVLEAYSDSDYDGANKDRKSTTCGCQFLCRRLISWQCKKQTIMATSSTEAEYVAAANCCGQFSFFPTGRPLPTGNVIFTSG